MSGPLRRLVVRALNGACMLIDGFAYRPAVVKLTERLPRWWCCQLAHVSMKLDERWHTGFWSIDSSPPQPNGPCDACGRRARWLIVGGDDDGGEQDPNDYLTRHPVCLCSWCRLEFDSPPTTSEELRQLLIDARSRSVTWRWR
jgi:hypothetical protein